MVPVRPVLSEASTYVRVLMAAQSWGRVPLRASLPLTSTTCTHGGQQGGAGSRVRGHKGAHRGWEVKDPRPRPQADGPRKQPLAWSFCIEANCEGMLPISRWPPEMLRYLISVSAE